MTFKINVYCFLVLLAYLQLGTSFAQSLQVVQSVPLETEYSLKVFGIPETKQTWIQMINSAETSIEIEQFYLASQADQGLDSAKQPLEDVIVALERAAARPVSSDHPHVVEIRLLIDSKFYLKYPEIAVRLGSFKNIEVRVIDFSKIGGGIQHSKYFIIDRKSAFLGSPNFDSRALNHIHEIGIKIEDPFLVAPLVKVFVRDWNSTWTRTSPSLLLLSNESDGREEQGEDAKRSKSFIVASPPIANPEQVPDSLSGILTLIGQAQHTISIQVMDYSTQIFRERGRWLILDSALRTAAGRGVKVQLLIDAHRVHQAKFELQSLSKVKNISIKAVDIPQWSGGKIDFARLIHSKYMIVDYLMVWIGTENWSKDYFIYSRNVGLITSDPKVNRDLRQVFYQVWNSPYSEMLNKTNIN